MWDRLSEQIYLNFIKDDRWQYFTNGLEVTLIIAFFVTMRRLPLCTTEHWETEPAEPTA